MKSPLLGAAIGLLFVSGCPAATLMVDARPNSAPHQTIQSALDKAQPGDVIKVAPGVYREHLRFPVGGESGKPIVLEGAEGAILDGSADVVLDWKPADDIAPGVFRAAVDFFPYTITANGQIVTTLDEKRTDPALPHPDRDNLRWPSVFKGGAGPAGWSGVRAIAMYRKKEQDLLIRFKKNLDPKTLAMTVSSKEPAISIRGVNFCTIKGLTIRNCAYGVMIQGAKGITVENCKIGPADYGVQIEGKSSQCAVRNNEITFAPYSGASPWRDGSWDNWQAHKNAGFYDRYAVRISESKDSEVSGNYIHDHWDGIQTGWPGAWEDNGGLNIQDNVLYNIFDDAMETSGGQANNRWHGNFIENARIGIRIKNPDQGPLYIYKNLFVGNKSDMVIWSSGKSFSPAEVWVYHNTCTADVSVGTNFAKDKAATENYHFYNNIFWCLSTLRRDPGYPLPDWKSDNNAYVRVTLENPRPWETESDAFDQANRDDKWTKSQEQMRQAGIDQQSIWSSEGQPGFVDVANRNLVITEASPASGKGRDLSKNEGRPLPGCEPGYFKGSQPNVGALQAGENMPALPVKSMSALKGGAPSASLSAK